MIFFSFSFSSRFVTSSPRVKLSWVLIYLCRYYYNILWALVHKYPTRCILYIPVVAYRLHSALLHSRCKGLSRATVPQTECSSTIPEFRVAGAYSSFFSGWRGSQGGSLVKVIQIHQKWKSFCFFTDGINTPQTRDPWHKNSTEQRVTDGTVAVVGVFRLLLFLCWFERLSEGKRPKKVIREASELPSLLCRIGGKGEGRSN